MPSDPQKEAKLRYTHASYEIEDMGSFVVCARTKQKIPLANMTALA